MGGKLEQVSDVLKALIQSERIGTTIFLTLLPSSVLDDNKMLTLPSGERLSIPNNMRIIEK